MTSPPPGADAKILDAALALGAAMRLTRLVVTDDLGQWWIKDRAQAACLRHYQSHEQHLPWWNKYLSGLDCPFCVGQWIAFAVLGAYEMPGISRSAWRFVAAGLTLNEVAAHLGARLGDTSKVTTGYEEPDGT